MRLAHCGAWLAFTYYTLLQCYTDCTAAPGVPLPKCSPTKRPAAQPPLHYRYRASIIYIYILTPSALYLCRVYYTYTLYPILYMLYLRAGLPWRLPACLLASLSLSLTLQHSCSCNSCACRGGPSILARLPLSDLLDLQCCTFNYTYIRYIYITYGFE